MPPTDPDPPRWPPRAAPPAAAADWRPTYRWVLASGYVDAPSWWPPAGRTSPRRSQWRPMSPAAMPPDPG